MYDAVDGDLLHALKGHKVGLACISPHVKGPVTGSSQACPLSAETMGWKT